MENESYRSRLFQQVYCILKKSKGILPKRIMFPLLVASLCHDVGHPGTNNDFHIKARSELSIIYSDRHVLEHYHSAQTFRILLAPGTDLLRGLSQKSYTTTRSQIVEAILATDMKVHNELLQKIEILNK